MKKIGLIVLAAFLGGGLSLGAYKLMERKTDGYTLEEKQNLVFANNPVKTSSAGVPDFVQAASLVSPAVVHIKTIYDTNRGNQDRGDMSDMFEQFFGFGGRGRIQRLPQFGSGSGVILTSDGYIVTNNHVIDKADKIEVILSNRNKVVAKVIGKDPNTDLALIKIDATKLPFAKMGNSDNVQIGEWVLAIGFPLDLQSTVTAGIVSAKSRSIGILANENYKDMSPEDYQRYQETGQLPVNESIESYIQTDAVINRGNSGGALINSNGELIGINAAIASKTGINEGYGFAIPINLAKKVLEDFKEYGKVKRGFIGVTFVALDADQADRLKIKDINGLYVNDVAPGGGAQAAGIAKGDIIKKVNGVVVYDSPDLQEKIARMHPGDKVNLSVLKADGKMKEISVILKGESNTALTSNKSNAKSGSATVAKLGATFAPASEKMKAKYNVKSGVIVTDVEAGKLFDYWGVSKGLLITKVNNIPVNTPADVEKALGNDRDGKTTISGVSDEGIFTYSFGN